jgi:hypothetical protein
MKSMGEELSAVKKSKTESMNPEESLSVASALSTY